MAETTQNDLLQYEITGHALATLFEVFKIDGVMVDHHNIQYIVLFDEEMLKFFYWEDLKESFPNLEFAHGHIVHLVNQGAGNNTIQ